jgi:hypothetical protein
LRFEKVRENEMFYNVMYWKSRWNSEMICHNSTYFSSIFFISFHYSSYLSSIFSLSFHYSTYISSVFSKSFHKDMEIMKEK